MNLEGVAALRQSVGLTELVALLLQAGLDPVRLQVVERTRTHPNGHAIIDFAQSSSFGNFLNLVPEALRPQLREDLAAAFDERRGPDGIATRDHGEA
jgi:arsenite methyltransferase